MRAATLSTAKIDEVVSAVNTSDSLRMQWVVFDGRMCGESNAKGSGDDQGLQSRASPACVRPLRSNDVSEPVLLNERSGGRS